MQSYAAQPYIRWRNHIFWRRNHRRCQETQTIGGATITSSATILIDIICSATLFIEGATILVVCKVKQCKHIRWRNHIFLWRNHRWCNKTQTICGTTISSGPTILIEGTTILLVVRKVKWHNHILCKNWVELGTYPYTELMSHTKSLSQMASLWLAWLYTHFINDLNQIFKF